MQATSARTDIGVWESPAEPSSVPLLRGAVKTYARDCGLTGLVVDDIALAVSEAVTNAVVHAYPPGEAVAPGTVEVEARNDANALLIRVADHGAGMRPRTDTPGLGVGLPMIGKLADEFDICEGPGGQGVEVIMTFRDKKKRTSQVKSLRTPRTGARTPPPRQQVPGRA